MRVFGHAMPTGKLGAEGGVIPISAISGRSESRMLAPSLRVLVGNLRTSRTVIAGSDGRFGDRNRDLRPLVWRTGLGSHALPPMKGPPNEKRSILPARFAATRDAFIVGRKYAVPYTHSDVGRPF